MKCVICGDDYKRSDGTETLDNYFVCLNCCKDEGLTTCPKCDFEF